MYIADIPLQKHMKQQQITHIPLVFLYCYFFQKSGDHPSEVGSWNPII